MLQEYAFRVKAADSPLTRFTAEHPTHRVFLNLLRGSTDRLEDRAVLVILGPMQETNRFLIGDFSKRYGTYIPLREEEDHVSVEVSTHLLPTIHRKTPNQLTYEVLGEDAIFLPIEIQDGWIRVRVLSANQQAGDRFIRFLEMTRKHLNAAEFVVEPVRPYRTHQPVRDAVEDITDRQMEVLREAYRMGYWADPRRCNLEDIAGRFQVSKAAVHKSLSAGQRKIMASFFHDVTMEHEEQAAERHSATTQPQPVRIL